MSAAFPTRGDVFASTDKRDVARVHNQQRRVVGVEGGYVYFERPGGGASYRVRRTFNGVRNHRFVRSTGEETN